MTRAADLAKLIAGGGTITVDDNSTNITLKSTDADSNLGPILDLLRDGGSPADSDFIGQVRFQAKDDGGNIHEYAKMFGQIADVTGGTEDGILNIRTVLGGTDTRRIDLGVTETVFNEDSADLDFRVESNGNANMLFVDAGNDKVGVGTSSPSQALHVSASNPFLELQGTASTSGDTGIFLNANANHWILKADNYSSTNAFQIKQGDTSSSTAYMTINSIGAVTKPLQPAFYAEVTGAQTLSANTLTTVAHDTERFDQNDDYNTSTYKFVAPVTGKYLLTLYLRLDRMDQASSYADIRIRTSNRNYQQVFDTDVQTSADLNFHSFGFSVVADMDANDEAYTSVYIEGSVSSSHGSTYVNTSGSTGFSGCLLA